MVGSPTRRVPGNGEPLPGRRNLFPMVNSWLERHHGWSASLGVSRGTLANAHCKRESSPSLFSSKMHQKCIIFISSPFLELEMLSSKVEEVQKGFMKDVKHHHSARGITNMVSINCAPRGGSSTHQ